MGTGKLGALGTKVEYQNTSWVAPAKGGVIVANQGQGLISYIDFRGADKLHELQNLSRPVMIGESYDRQGMSHWYAACAGGFGFGSGLAVGVERLGWRVFEHEVPASFK